MRTRTMRPPGPAQDMRFCLAFPRESLTIPFMRHVLGDALFHLGVDEECVSDLLLAVTEACTNVLRHAGPGSRYEVLVRINQNRCLLRVLDDGPGFALPRLAGRRSQSRRAPVRPGALRRRRPAETSDVSALPESGRGLAIMRACVDDVSLRSGPGRGTVVSLRKRIEWRENGPDSGDQFDWTAPALRSVG